MQGGGYGFTSPMFGMNCDQVMGFHMALADGRIVKASAKENADLFWAVRGGTGNNFGVLLEIEYRLQRTRPVMGHSVSSGRSNRRTAAAAARALSCLAGEFHRRHGPAESRQRSDARPHHRPGQATLAPYFLIRGMFHGSEADCRKALEPLLRLMPDVKNIATSGARDTYRELNEYLLNYPTELPANVPASARSLAKSHIVGRT